MVIVTTALIVSNVLLWCLVIGLSLLVFALARQIGVLHERVAPVGALMPMNGPKIGEKISPVSVTTLSGQTIDVGETAKRTFIYFLSPGCPVCKSLLPVVQSLAEQENDVEVLYASDGEQHATHTGYADTHGIRHHEYILSTELGISLGVSKLPFAVLIDDEGVLRARGLVNNREHLESLLAADELDVSSLQEYLGDATDGSSEQGKQA